MPSELIEMRRGDTPDLDIVVKEPPTYEGQPFDERSPFDLSGCDIWLTAKRSPDDADVDAIFQLSTDDGTITIADAINGLCTAQPLASQTSGLTKDTQGFYDVQVRTADVEPRTYTVLNGQIVITRDITRA
jgi:hypothetical protein